MSESSIYEAKIITFIQELYASKYPGVDLTTEPSENKSTAHWCGFEQGRYIGEREGVETGHFAGYQEGLDEGWKAGRKVGIASSKNRSWWRRLTKQYE